MLTTLVPPSASASICPARSEQTAATAAARWPGSGRAPEAPEASSSTVSLVDWAPSTVIRLKVAAAAVASASSRSAGSATASVVSTASMVACGGATAGARPPERSRAAAALATPSLTRAASSGTPITPVEQTSTCSGRQPSSAAARSTVVSTAASPAGPVQALALPEFSTTTRASAEAASRSRDQTTGAATTWLVVNTPAATVPGSPTIRARSAAPEGLSPQATPAAPNPAAAVTPSRRSAPAPRLPGPPVGRRRHLGPVGGGDRPGGRPPPTRLEDVDERLAAVGGRVAGG